MDIEMNHIVKAFGSNQVLNDVSILIKHGTIHGIEYWFSSWLW